MSQADIDRRLLQIANEAIPYEACGFIIDDGIIVEVENVSKTPMSSFEMDRGDVILRLSSVSGKITGIWHTHPRGNQNPSATDWEAFKVGSINLDWDYYIATPNAVTLIKPGQVQIPITSHWNRFIA